MSDEVMEVVTSPEQEPDFMLMLIGALGSIDERLSIIETEMRELNQFRVMLTQAVEGMAEHPMFKMLMKKKQ